MGEEIIAICMHINVFMSIRVWEAGLLASLGQENWRRADRKFTKWVSWCPLQDWRWTTKHWSFLRYFKHKLPFWDIIISLIQKVMLLIKFPNPEPASSFQEWNVRWDENGENVEKVKSTQSKSKYPATNRSNFSLRSCLTVSMLVLHVRSELWPSQEQHYLWSCGFRPFPTTLPYCLTCRP